MKLRTDYPEVFKPSATTGPLPLPSRTAEFSTPLAMYNDFEQFLSLHVWSMNTIASAAIHLMDDGAQRLQRTPLVVRFLIAPVRVPHKMTPANSWMLREWEILPFNDDHASDVFAGMSEQTKACFQTVDVQYRERFGDRYLGTAFTWNCFERSILSIPSQCPIFTLRNPDALRDPANRRALEDLITLCVSCASKGVPLQLAVDTTQPIAYPGVAVKRGKSWVWDQLDLQFLDRFFEKCERKTTLSPKELMMLFASL